MKSLPVPCPIVSSSAGNNTQEMSSVKTQLVMGGGNNGLMRGNGGGDDLMVKSKGDIFNCLDDILMANETAIVLPHSAKQLHPIVLVEPKIEIKVELNERKTENERLLESFLQVPSAELVVGGRSKSKGSISPHSHCSNESVARRHHHNSHHHHHHRHHVKHESLSEDVDKENVLDGEVEAEDHHRHHHNHHHRHGVGHHHHHHHHTHGHHKGHNTSSTAAVDGSVAVGEVVKPEQVLRKYIIKKITIRKQDGSTKKIVIKKAVDDPSVPVKLTKVQIV